MTQSGGKRRTRKRAAKRRPAKRKTTRKPASKKRVTKRPVKRVAKRRPAKRKPARKPAKSKAKRKGARKRRTSSLSSKYSIEMLVSPHADTSHLGYLGSGGGLEDLDHAADQVNQSSDAFYNELRSTRSSRRRVAKRKGKRRAGKRKAKRKPKRKAGKRKAKRRPAKRKAPKRKATRRKSSGKRKATRKRTGKRKASRAPRGLKELANMGEDRLRLGLQPPLAHQLVLDPELGKKVALADPMARNLLSKYGPGWSGYKIGMQVRGKNKDTVMMTSSSPDLGVAMHPYSHPLVMGHGLEMTGLPGASNIALSSMLLGGPLGNGGRVSEWGLRSGLGLNNNVQVEEGLKRAPQDRMNVKSQYPWGLPNVMTTGHVSVGTRGMPSMAHRRPAKQASRGVGDENIFGLSDYVGKQSSQEEDPFQKSPPWEDQKKD